MKQKINSTQAPAAIGPYSQAVMEDGLIFVSGQLPIDYKTGEFSSQDVAEQTRQSLENIKAILDEVGYGMERIMKTTVYLKNMDDFTAMNQVYETYFTDPYPARAAFQVAKLPKDAKVEIEAVAK